MSEIKIVEKIVAPNTNWTQLIIDRKDEVLERCAYKILFDRTYPYFWICPRFGGMDGNGLALTYADVERAAVFDNEKEAFEKFDFTADGVLPLNGNTAICIAMGARQAFYILSNAGYSDNGGGYTFYVSAQDDPVCPFAQTNPYS